MKRAFIFVYVGGTEFINVNILYSVFGIKSYDQKTHRKKENKKKTRSNVTANNKANNGKISKFSPKTQRHIPLIFENKVRILFTAKLCTYKLGKNIISKISFTPRKIPLTSYHSAILFFDRRTVICVYVNFNGILCCYFSFRNFFDNLLFISSSSSEYVSLSVYGLSTFMCTSIYIRDCCWWLVYLFVVPVVSSGWYLLSSFMCTFVMSSFIRHRMEQSQRKEREKGNYHTNCIINRWIGSLLPIYIQFEVNLFCLPVLYMSLVCFWYFFRPFLFLCAKTKHIIILFGSNHRKL